MVDFNNSDKISRIQELLSSQKKKEKKIEKTIEELEKVKKESSTNTKKIEDLLNEALSELDEESLKKAREIMIKPVIEVVDSDDSPVQEIIEEGSIGDVYKPQDAIMKETYSSLEEVYRSVGPVDNNSAIAKQAMLYKNLAQLRETLARQKNETGYNKELDHLESAYHTDRVKEHSTESDEFERISGVAKNLAEIAGSDEFGYQERTQNILNEIKKDIQHLAYRR